MARYELWSKLVLKLRAGFVKLLESIYTNFEDRIAAKLTDGKSRLEALKSGFTVSLTFTKQLQLQSSIMNCLDSIWHEAIEGPLIMALHKLELKTKKSQSIKFKQIPPETFM